MALKIYQLYTTKLNPGGISSYFATKAYEDLSVQTLCYRKATNDVHFFFYGFLNLRVFLAGSEERGADAFRARLVTDVVCVFVSTVFGMSQENWHTTQHRPSLEMADQI